MLTPIQWYVFGIDFLMTKINWYQQILVEVDLKPIIWSESDHVDGCDSMAFDQQKNINNENQWFWSAVNSYINGSSKFNIALYDSDHNLQVRKLFNVTIVKRSAIFVPSRWMHSSSIQIQNVTRAWDHISSNKRTTTSFIYY